MNRVPDEVRAARAAALAPLFAVLKERGIKRTWFAQQVGHGGMTHHNLWQYEHGHARVPAQFIEQACKALGIPASLIPIPEPRSLYIQQPRSVKSTTTERTEKQDDPQQPQRRTRRTQPTASDAPVAHHTARHGAVASGSSSRASRSSGDSASPASSRASADAANGPKRRVARSRNRTGVGDGLAVPGNL